jgi:hypothetical protein
MIIESAKANAITVFTDFLSVPKIMGIGPIMITPAPFIFPLFGLPVDAMIMAVMMIITPTMKSVMPNV